MKQTIEWIDAGDRLPTEDFPTLFVDTDGDVFFSTSPTRVAKDCYPFWAKIEEEDLPRRDFIIEALSSVLLGRWEQVGDFMYRNEAANVNVLGEGRFVWAEIPGRYTNNSLTIKGAKHSSNLLSPEDAVLALRNLMATVDNARQFADHVKVVGRTDKEGKSPIEDGFAKYMRNR